MAQNPTYLPAKSNWRLTVVNVNHLHHKRAVFESCTTYIKPDVIFGTEAELDPSTNVQEIPPDYQKNRFINYRNRHGGGTFIDVKNCYTATELQLDLHATHRDVVWVKVSISGETTLYLCSFYRAPGSGSAPLTCLHELARIADEKIINMAGDFNCLNIDWESNAKQLRTRARIHESVITYDGHISRPGITELELGPSENSYSRARKRSVIVVLEVGGFHTGCLVTKRCTAHGRRVICPARQSSGE